jgi:serine/threonine protein kinase
MATDKIGKFLVLQPLGAGAHSSILKIRREADGREYALKIVNIDDADDRKFLDQAKHEFRVGEMLGHANLLKVFLFETESDWLFRVKKAKILLEYMPGSTLDKVPIVNPAKLIAVFAQAAAGVAHMHTRGVLHADLKPNNIIYGKGKVKVIDYGLAWIKGEPKDRVQGTPEYMAPETGTHKLINERTDIFNFGATMYRLTTLKLPPPAIAINGLDVNEKEWTKALAPAHTINKAIPKELARLIHACLSFKAHNRPESMTDVQAKLDELAGEYILDEDA